MEKRENTSKKDKVAKNPFYCLYPEAITACKLYSSKRGCMRKTECAICFWLGHKIITLNIIFRNFENPWRIFRTYSCVKNQHMLVLLQITFHENRQSKVKQCLCRVIIRRPNDLSTRAQLMRRGSRGARYSPFVIFFFLLHWVKHGVEVDMTIQCLPSVWHSVTPRPPLKNPGLFNITLK